MLPKLYGNINRFETIKIKDFYQAFDNDNRHKIVLSHDM